MNKKRFSLAILVMAVVAFASVAVVSCKKDNTVTQTGNNETSKSFDVSQIEDMNAYLKEFKNKMRLATKEDDEMLSLEEAEWHLSSLANYDFANANVAFDDIRMDTLYASVPVNNGIIRMSDLGATYDRISNAIDAFYQDLDLQNKHFRFIGASISKEGEVVIRMITTFTVLNRLWYFPNENYADSICELYFNDGPYPANGYGMTHLAYVLNLIATTPQYPGGRIFYVASRQKGFYCENYLDPDSPSSNPLHSRLYCSVSYYNADMGDDICYYCDSYAGLGYEYCTMNEVVLEFILEFRNAGLQHDPDAPCLGNHYLTVTYGLPTTYDGNFDY